MSTFDSRLCYNGFCKTSPAGLTFHKCQNDEVVPLNRLPRVYFRNTVTKVCCLFCQTSLVSMFHFSNSMQVYYWKKWYGRSCTDFRIGSRHKNLFCMCNYAKSWKTHYHYIRIFTSGLRFQMYFCLLMITNVALLIVHIELKYRLKL